MHKYQSHAQQGERPAKQARQFESTASDSRMQDAGTGGRKRQGSSNRNEDAEETKGAKGHGDFGTSSTKGKGKQEGRKGYIGKGRGGYSHMAQDQRAREGDVDEMEKVWEAINTHNRVLQRVCYEQRQTARQFNLVVEIGPELEQLRQSMEEASNQWHNDRPRNGPHEAGPLDLVLWWVLVDYVCTMDMAKGATDQEGAKLLQAALRDTLGRPANEANKEAGFGDKYPHHLLICFNNVGRRRARSPQGKWVWITKLDHSRATARELHERILHEGESIQFLRFRKEHGAPDNLEKSLRNLYISEQ